MGRQPKCPICQRTVLLRSEDPSFPFCSPRCRAIDFGKWVGEEYRVAERGNEEREDELPPSPGNGRSGDA